MPDKIYTCNITYEYPPSWPDHYYYDYTTLDAWQVLRTVTYFDLPTGIPYKRTWLRWALSWIVGDCYGR